MKNKLTSSFILSGTHPRTHSWVLLGTSFQAAFVSRRSLKIRYFACCHLRVPRVTPDLLTDNDSLYIIFYAYSYWVITDSVYDEFVSSVFFLMPCTGSVFRCPVMGLSLDSLRCDCIFNASYWACVSNPHAGIVFLISPVVPVFLSPVLGFCFFDTPFWNCVVLPLLGLCFDFLCWGFVFLIPRSGIVQ